MTAARCTDGTPPHTAAGDEVPATASSAQALGAAGSGETPVATGGRRVLLLQGPPSRFFNVLADAFTAAGHSVTRVHLHAGDLLRARGKGLRFAGALPDFGPYLADLMDARGITDVLYYADRLPYHRIAAATARRSGAIPYAIENGYLRPDWLTLEPFGMGAFSRFPVQRAAIAAIADGAPPVDGTVRFSHSFATEAYYDVSHTLARLAGAPLFPRFQRDRHHHPIKEYLSWLRLVIRRQVAQARAPAQMRRVLSQSKPFFLFPMQLQEDYQISDNSRYAALADLVDEVFSSFARGAPPDATLLVKIHPLDNGLQNWRRTLKGAKRAYGLTGRIRLVAAGSLAEMLRHTEGVVLVNSTVGLTALREGVAVKALGVAIYEGEGLTDPQPLDAFWQAPARPDPKAVDEFVRALARATQLKGSFYDPVGMVEAAREIVSRVAGAHGTRHWFLGEPPRLTTAREKGVPARALTEDVTTLR